MVDDLPPELHPDAAAWDHRNEPLLLDFLASIYEDELAGRTFAEAAYRARYGAHADRLLRYYTGLRGTAAASRRLGPFTLLRELARGGQAVVWEAEDPQLARKIALKVMRPDAAQLPIALERFTREAALAARLSDPGLCPIHATGVDDGCLWIAMQLLPGGTLRERLAADRANARPGRRRTRDLVATAIALLRTLARLHDAGIVHRDLKPGNIAFDACGRAVVLDLGLAAALGDDTTRTDVAAGTPQYMAPEQVRGQPIDARTDVHAVGVILWEAIALNHPFADGAPTRERIGHAILTVDPPPLRRHCPLAATDRDLDAVLATAMAKEPDRRHASAGAFADDLERWLRGMAVLARPVGPWGRLWRRARRQPLLATSMTVAIAALVSGCLITTLLWWQLRSERSGTQTALLAAQGAGLRAEALRLQSTEPTLALRLALAAFARDPGPTSASTLWTTWAAAPVVDELPPGELPLTCHAIAADRTVLIVGDRGGATRLWRPGDDVHEELPRGDGPVTAVALSPDGSAVAIANGSWLRVRRHGDTVSHHLPATANDLACTANNCLAGLADGRICRADTSGVTVIGHADAGVQRVVALANAAFATIDARQHVLVFGAEGRRLAGWPLPPHTPPLLSTAEGGRWLFAMAALPVGAAVRAFDLQSGIGRSLAVAPRLEWFDVADDRSELVVATGLGHALRVDVATGDTASIEGVGRTWRVARATGGTLAGVGLDGSAWLRLPDGRRRVQSLGSAWPRWFGLDAAGLPLAVFADGSARRWRLHGAAEVVCGRPGTSHGRLAIAADGSWVAALDQALVWRHPDGHEARLPCAEALHLLDLRVAPDCRHVAAVGPDGSVRVMARDGSVRLHLARTTMQPLAEFLAAGRIAVADERSLELIGLDGEASVKLPMAAGVHRLVVARGRRWIGVADTGGAVLVLDADGRVSTRTVLSPPIGGLAVADDGVVFAVDGGSNLHVIEPGGRLRASLGSGGSWCTSLELHPDGSEALIGGNDGVVRRVDRDGVVLATVRPGTGLIRTAIWVAERELIATLTANGHLHVHARDGALRFSVRPTGPMPAATLAASADGHHLWLARAGHAFTCIPLAPDELLAAATARAGGPATAADRGRFPELLPTEVADDR